MEMGAKQLKKETHEIALPSGECKGQYASNADSEHSGRVTNDPQCSQLLSLAHIHTRHMIHSGSDCGEA